MTIASVVITTRNRRAEVLRAIESSLAQAGTDLEVIVFDDESQDGTADAIREAFPEVRLVPNERRAGLVANRSRGFREARGTYVFSLDDDAYFTRSDIVTDVIACFEADASIGAVAIPYLEPLASQSSSTRGHRPTVRGGDEVASFAGCAHAVRRHIAIGLGGYRDYFVHQGEERDLCLRMWASGSRVVYGRSAHVVHSVSPERDGARMMYYGGRNRLLFDWLNLPFPDVLVRSLWDPVALIRYRYSWASLPLKLRSIGAGFAEALRRVGQRRAVPRATYRRFARLPGHGPEHWDGPLPDPCSRSLSKDRFGGSEASALRPDAGRKG